MNIPQFTPAPFGTVRGGPMTRDETEGMARRVEAAWHNRGHYAVRAWVISEEQRDKQKQLIFGIRSNLVGGLPPRVVA